MSEKKNIRLKSSIQTFHWRYEQCCGSGYRIRCLFYPWIRDPRSRIGKISRSGSGINILDRIPRDEKQFLGLKILKLFDADPGSGIFLTLDPGLKMGKFGSGILEKHPGSGTLDYTGVPTRKQFIV
jgi:hypothetical protein